MSSTALAIATPMPADATIDVSVTPAAFPARSGRTTACVATVVNAGFADPSSTSTTIEFALPWVVVPSTTTLPPDGYTASARTPVARPVVKVCARFQFVPSNVHFVTLGARMLT